MQHTKENILNLAKNNPASTEVLKTLFPEFFDEKSKSEFDLLIEFMELRQKYYENHYRLHKNEIDLRYSAILIALINDIKLKHHLNSECIESFKFK